MRPTTIFVIAVAALLLVALAFLAGAVASMRWKEQGRRAITELRDVVPVVRCGECTSWSKTAPKDFMEKHPDYSGGWCSEIKQGECDGGNAGCWMATKAKEAPHDH